MKLVVEFVFSDDSDFEYYRTRFVGQCEDMAEEAQDKEEEGSIFGDRGKADGTIEVNWDTED